MRILLVDDDAEILTVLREYFEALEHEVVTATSGREAIVALAAQDSPFNVALVDWQMAGISGRELLKHLAEHYPHTLTYVSTGHGEDIVSERNLAGLARGVFRKPFSLRKLARALEEALASR